MFRGVKKVDINRRCRLHSSPLLAIKPSPEQELTRAFTGLRLVEALATGDQDLTHVVGMDGDDQLVPAHA